MAYYTAFVTQWNTLTPGTTAAKLAQINGQTVTGSVPATFPMTGAQLFTLINWTEFMALTAAQQATIWNALHLASAAPLTGGAGTTLGNAFVTNMFPPAGPTITAFAAFAKGLTQPWWQANGYNAPFNTDDCISAGVS